jgi:hypothetical protein
MNRVKCEWNAVGSQSAVPSPSPARERTPALKMLQRLNGAFESGKVMPVAFLQASQAAPIALLSFESAHVVGGKGAGSDSDSSLSRSALKLVSDLAAESMLASVPQQMRVNYMKQVCDLAKCGRLYGSFAGTLD